MKVNLNQIKASPNPIRKSWDETKMDELRWSLMEEGQVEPIGVHENGHGGYVIVWGHRRVQAARLAGWGDIEAVVVPQDEVDNLIQAGIENLSSEDMSADEKAEWAQRLIDLGLSQREISRRSTVPQPTISNWITAKQEKDAGVNVIDFNHHAKDEGVRKLMELRQVLGDDLEAKKAVATKVSTDKLTKDQTREVAQAYRDAKTPEIKAQVLKAPVVSRDTAADILRRSMHRYEMETGVKIQEEMNDWEKERDERQTMQNWNFAVQDFLNSVKLFKQVLDNVGGLVKYGKFSPEAARFAARRLDQLMDVIKNAKEELENVQ